MSDLSPRLSLPYLLPAQAQKHVTHNEALSRLDLLVQLAVEGFDAETPPVGPAEGQIWATGAAPTGAWAGQPHCLAAWADNAWLFVSLAPGWRAVGAADNAMRIWSGSAWETPGTPAPVLENIPGVGINATSDAVNRLSVAAGATLLSHDGAGHQVKVNKAAAGDTASLLFQTGWSGRAEMGCAGADDFAIKVSADGTAWTTALAADAATGQISAPGGIAVTGALTGTAVQQTAADTTPGRLARADYAYGPGNVLGTVAQAAGVPTGAVIETGSNANGSYVRFACGTQICWVNDVDMGSIVAAGAGTFTSPWRTNPVILTWPAAFVAPPVGSWELCPAVVSVPLDARALALNCYATPTATGWLYLRASRIGSDAYDVNILLSVTAIGRWF